MTFSVKKVEPETVLEVALLPGGKQAGRKSPKSVTWGVVDECGVLVKTENPLTRKRDFEIYPQKQTAQRVADHMNSLVLAPGTRSA